MARAWIIYLLHDASGEPDYVGFTRSFKRRIHDHTRNRGFAPRFEILEEGKDDEAGGKAEQRWIAEYERRGAKLKNVHPGGNFSSSAPRRFSADGISRSTSRIKPGRVMSPEHEEKRLAGVKAWWANQSPEERARRASARTQGYLASSTVEERSKIGKRVAEKRLANNTYAYKPRYKRPGSKPETSTKMKSFWANLSFEDRAALVAKRAVAIQAAWDRKKTKAKS